MTVTILAKAAAIPRSTLQWYLASGRLPAMPLTDGVQAISVEMLPKWVALIASLRAKP